MCYHQRLNLCLDPLFRPPVITPVSSHNLITHPLPYYNVFCWFGILCLGRRKSKHPYKDVFQNTHGSFIHNIPKLKPPQHPSMGKWMNKPKEKSIEWKKYQENGENCCYM